MILRYCYAEDGYTHHGDKIPDVPVVHLALRVGRYLARGLAIVDTGFDGGVYPNMDVVKLFRGVKPVKVVEFEHPAYGICEFEVYQAEVFLYHGGVYTELGLGNVYIPVEPELISEEVLVGREILNKLELTLNARRMVTVVKV
ncbi:MAG: hypothetical protein J7L98_01440 [Candidatus Verstraetearchaeota archaeon]|nr:hypothetical protein [Candidatus Verstraetearchaeota archaeon]